MDMTPIYSVINNVHLCDEIMTRTILEIKTRVGMDYGMFSSQMELYRTDI